MIAIGIDIGSRTTKAVLMDDGEVIARKLELTTWGRADQARKLLELLIAESGLTPSQVDATWATGYGRISATFADGQTTEITCHALGAHYIDPQIRTLIDVGGQDCKVISFDAAGQVLDFCMNDRCAAGTGKFLEVMATTLGLSLDELVACGLKAQQAAKISSLCTVFAESEAISLLAEGVPLEEVVLGLHDAIAGRISSFVRGVGLERKVAFSGGGAKNAVLHRELESHLKETIRVLDQPEYVGALGAGLLARAHALNGGLSSEAKACREISQPPAEM